MIFVITGSGQTRETLRRQRLALGLRQEDRLVLPAIDAHVGLAESASAISRPERSGPSHATSRGVLNSKFGHCHAHPGSEITRATRPKAARPTSSGVHAALPARRLRAADFTAWMISG